MAPNKGKRGGKAPGTAQHDRVLEGYQQHTKIMALHNEITREIHDATIKDNTLNGEFIPEASIQKIWTTERLKQFLEITEIINAGMDNDAVSCATDHAQKHFKKIISILFGIVWTKWSSFKGIFWDLRDEDEAPARSDGKMPFTGEELENVDFLEPFFGSKFEKEQFKFIPVCIKADPHNKLEEGLKLPLYQMEKIAVGAFGTVFKAAVPCGQFEYRERGRPLNRDELLIAVKSFKFEDSFEEEVKNLSTIRDALSEPKRILSFLATVSLGNQCYIFSHLADMDLEVFLTKTTTRFKFTMANLIAEASCLTDALDFLHTRIKIPTAGGQSQHVACCHMDLKPNNILVFQDPKHPVGIWCITDFGISTIRDNPFPLRNKGKQRLGVPTTVGMITSSAKTNAKRGPGTYQAPEVNCNEGMKNIGRKSDIYSLGCILTRVFAFGLGDRRELIDFDKGRRAESGGAGDDYFYKTCSDPPYIINPHVKKFLDKLPGYKSMGSTETENLDYHKAKEILLRMLNPSDARSRPEASEVYNELNAIFPQITKSNSTNVNTHSRSNSSASLVTEAFSSRISLLRPSRSLDPHGNSGAHNEPSSNSRKPFNPISPSLANASIGQTRAPALLEVSAEGNPPIFLSPPRPSRPSPPKLSQPYPPGPSRPSPPKLSQPYLPGLSRPSPPNPFQPYLPGPSRANPVDSHESVPVSGLSQGLLPTPGRDTDSKEVHQPPDPSHIPPAHIPLAPPKPPPDAQHHPARPKHPVVQPPPPEAPAQSIISNTRSLNSLAKPTSLSYHLSAPNGATGAFISPSGRRLVLISKSQVYLHSVNNKSIACEIPQHLDLGIMKMNWIEARVVDDYLFLKGRAKKPREFDVFAKYQITAIHQNRMSFKFFRLLKGSFNSMEISALGKVAYVYDSGVMLDISRLEGPEKIQGDIHRAWFGASGIWCFTWTKAASSQFVYIWDARSPKSPISFKHDFKDSDKTKVTVKGIISFPNSRAYIFWERDDFLSIIRSPADIGTAKRTKISNLKAVVVTPDEDMVVLVSGTHVSVSRLGSKVGDWDDTRECKLKCGFEETGDRCAVAVKGEGRGEAGFTVVIGHKNGNVEEVCFAPGAPTG